MYITIDRQVPTAPHYLEVPIANLDAVLSSWTRAIAARAITYAMHPYDPSMMVLTIPPQWCEKTTDGTVIPRQIRRSID